MDARTALTARGANQRPPVSVDPFERDKGRFGHYTEAKTFVDRQQWLGRPRPGERRPVFNYALTLCRKAISYVFPEPVTFTVPGPNQEPEDVTSAVERLLADTLHLVDADELDFALALDSAIFGDAAVKITWDARLRRPRVTAVDPGTLAVDWSPDTPTEPWRVHQRYTLPGIDLVTRGFVNQSSPLQPASLYPVTETWTANLWQMEVAGQPAREQANPYGWIPYLVLPNNRRSTDFWGHSDLEDMYDVFRLVNGRLRDLDEILTLSGAPITVLENVEGSDGIAVRPGAKWELPADAKAYLLNLLEHDVIGQHVTFIDTLYRVMHDLSESPRTAFGDSGRDLSGAALEVEIQPLVQKIKRKRRALDRFYRARNRMLLDLLERYGGAPAHGLRRTVTVWPPILPSDEETRVSLVTQQINATILSRRSGMAALGNTDPERELFLIEEEITRLANAQPQPNQGDQNDQAQSSKAGDGKEKQEPPQPTVKPAKEDDDD